MGKERRYVVTRFAVTRWAWSSTRYEKTIGSRCVKMTSIPDKMALLLPLHPNFDLLQIPFKYREAAEDKMTLVKVTVCPECASKLQHHSRHEKVRDHPQTSVSTLHGTLSHDSHIDTERKQLQRAEITSLDQTFPSNPPSSSAYNTQQNNKKRLLSHPTPDESLYEAKRSKTHDDIPPL